MDSGLQDAREFILERLVPLLTNEIIMKDSNFKSILLELVQSQGKEAPKYSVIDSTGPDHEKEFLVAVFVTGQEMGRGSGKSKKQAEQAAAHQALESVLREHSMLDDNGKET